MALQGLGGTDEHFIYLYLRNLNNLVYGQFIISIVLNTHIHPDQVTQGSCLYICIDLLYANMSYCSAFKCIKMTFS